MRNVTIESVNKSSVNHHIFPCKFMLVLKHGENKCIRNTIVNLSYCVLFMVTGELRGELHSLFTNYKTQIQKAPSSLRSLGVPLACLLGSYLVSPPSFLNVAYPSVNIFILLWNTVCRSSLFCMLF